MRIVVAGGSGLLGSALVKARLEHGDDVAVLTRNPQHVRVGRAVVWHPGTAGSWCDEVAAADAVVNYAGENLGAGRWTAKRKARLRESRTGPTSALARVLTERPGDRVFVSASAVGYFGDRGDEVLDETSPAGKGFVADLCKEWEATAEAARSHARVVIPRFGVVFARGSGALPRMLLPFRMFAGGRLGDGNQWLSWIDIDDATRFVSWAIDTAEARGVYDATAPQPIRNRDLAREIGRLLHRPSIFPVPRFVLRAVLGEMSEVVTASQRVIPRRALEEKFEFAYSEARSSLRLRAQ